MTLDTKSVHTEAKAGLHEIWMAPNWRTAQTAFDRFPAVWEEKYPKATACLARDRASLLAFYDFPAAHWQHIRTTHPIESSFATIRLRAPTTRNCVSAKSGVASVYKLAMSAESRLRRLRGFSNTCPKSSKESSSQTELKSPNPAGKPPDHDPPSYIRFDINSRIGVDYTRSDACRAVLRP